MMSRRTMGIVALALIAGGLAFLVLTQASWFARTQQPEDSEVSSLMVVEPAGSSGVDTRDWDDIDACADGILPEELEPVVDDIEAGGPYDYPDRDGSTFGNREAILPDEARGYYREFTVETPGLSHRGAKRVVTGGGGRDPEVWYYTEDHYVSFCEFAPVE